MDVFAFWVFDIRSFESELVATSLDPEIVDWSPSSGEANVL